MDKKIAIFCAASEKMDAKYSLAAREAVRALHALGYGIVSGGGKVGLMGAVTGESIRCGGHHIGVLPSFMKGLENPGVSQVVWTETMAERKAYMRSACCAVLALPGGIGTIDELVETHTLLKLHRWEGKILVLNVDGFFDPYIALMDHLVQTGALEPRDRDLLLFPKTVDELVAALA